MGIFSYEPQRADDDMKTKQTKTLSVFCRIFCICVAMLRLDKLEICVVHPLLLQSYKHVDKS